jgi:hypothetical protein
MKKLKARFEEGLTKNSKFNSGVNPDNFEIQNVDMFIAKKVQN